MAAAKKRLVTVTALGVSAKADPEGLDDYDLLMVVSEHGWNDTRSIEAIGKALFGEAGWMDAKEALRDESGKLRSSTVADFIDQAGKQLDALKN